MIAAQPLRVAILDASHWHVPLYLDALRAPSIHVVAVSDRNPEACAQVAAPFAAACHTTPETLLARHAIDFAFVFSEHATMPDTARMLIARRIPFAIEKPCGLTGAAVAALAAEATGLFVAVPFILRLGAIPKTLQDLEGPLPARIDHLGFRFMAGPAARYRAASPWMLDPARSGGGCAINLAPHFIDLVHLLAGQPITQVTAAMRHGTPNVAVEDHAALTLTGADGTIATIETAYTYPSTPTDLREFSFSLSAAHAYLRTTETGIRIRRRDHPHPTHLEVDLATDPLYGVFVTATLGALRAGAPPPADLHDAAKVMRVLDAAYASAMRGGTPVRINSTTISSRISEHWSDMVDTPP